MSDQTAEEITIPFNFDIYFTQYEEIYPENDFTPPIQFLTPPPTDVLGYLFVVSSFLILPHSTKTSSSRGSNIKIGLQFPFTIRF